MGRASKDDILLRVMRNKKVCQKLIEAEALLVDEISMISADLFEMISFVIAQVRGCPDRPFGGLKLVRASHRLGL